MFRVSESVMSAINRLLKNLNSFFHIVLETGAVSVIIFNQESLIVGFTCRICWHNTSADWTFFFDSYRNNVLACNWCFLMVNTDILSLLEQSSCMFSSWSWTWEVSIRNLISGYVSREQYLVLYVIISSPAA